MKPAYEERVRLGDSKEAEAVLRGRLAYRRGWPRSPEDDRTYMTFLVEALQLDGDLRKKYDDLWLNGWDSERDL